MTTIAYRDGVMCSDSNTFVHDGYCRMPGKVQKIHRLDDGSLMGHAGAWRDAHALKLWLMDQKGEPPDTKDVTALVVKPDRRVLIIDGTAQRYVEAPFYAIGSGAQTALGAMYAGADAVEAVRIAALVDCFTGGEIQVEKL